MKVVLSTSGKSHIFALGRELERLNVLARIYTGFPWFKLKDEGLPRTKVKSLPIVRPLLMITSRAAIRPRLLTETLHYLSLISLDAYSVRTMPECDVFVGHEGVGLWSGSLAQRRGAVYICDRGCTHMRWKVQTLKAEYDRVGMKWPGLTYSYERELEEYDRADHIVVPSRFARDTFIECGVDGRKVSVVPYGVNLSRFAPLQRRDETLFDILFVGSLSVRKGAHDLLTAFEQVSVARKRLTIAGVIDPDTQHALRKRLQASNVRLLGHVPQVELRHLMASSHVLVLPSVEEGLALVLAEALACACPIVATTNTGALDLIEDGVEGFVVPARCPDSISDRLTKLWEDPDLHARMSQAALLKVQKLGGWENYGLKMLEVYREVLTPSRGG